ncbi:MAG: hypothetical protein C3F13_00210 [Anaerolineales bacterium]|nr:hypothetical protein [Anaerolineae bacterium]PWB56883.1 MAG: hypothetical protein C3F13_00210 [Anaerolineales bacterium]
MSPKRSRLFKTCLVIPLGAVGLLVLITAILDLTNIGLPQHSLTIDHLSELEKARLAEVIHLRKSLGDDVWPGWSQADIPLIVYNEQYVFLVGYPDPPAGWKKVPSMEQRGGTWEIVPADTFEGQPYYRTELTDRDKTPQGFTVLVGDRWVATFMTREYGQVNFYQDFRKNFPPVISDLIPVRLVWAFLMGKSESYIAALEHESFHSLEGMLALNTFNASEEMYSVEANYPYDAMDDPWKQEMNVLVDAAQAATDAEARDLANQFLQLRTERHKGLTTEEIRLEQLREWEEGLAKYAELKIMRQADAKHDYLPIESMAQDKDFKYYKNQQRFWTQQLEQAASVGGLSGDTRFYYSGNAIAVLLDRLMPGWKPRALPGGEYLDDLLQVAVE